MSLEQRRTIRNLPGGYMPALLQSDALVFDRANVAGYALMSDVIALLETVLAKLDGTGKLDPSQIPATVALLLSPALSGTPTAPTPANGTSTTQIATTAFVQAAINLLIAGAPGALDTLKELADAINDDASYAATITNALALKAPLASPALTGAPTAPTPLSTDNSTRLATTAMVQAVVAALASNVAGKNAVINGDFRINQRVYASAGVLAAGLYAHDRWKAGATGGDYSFAQLPNSTTITIAAGKTLMQVIEDKNIAGGTYTLSWSGTAQGRIGINGAAPAGAYAASPITVAGVSAGQKATLEFNPGTLTNVQFELGSAATPFERRLFGVDFTLCQRYYQKSYDYTNLPGTGGLFTGAVRTYIDGLTSAVHTLQIAFRFMVPMRAVPTMVAYSPNSGTSGKFYDPVTPADIVGTFINTGNSGAWAQGTMAAANPAAVVDFHYTAEAEI